MATLIENLETRKAAIGVELAAMSATTAGGKPDASKAGVQHVAYRLSLLQELKMLEEQINREGLNATDGNATAFDVVSYVEV